VVIRTVPTKEAIMEILTEVKDPELPVIDIVELGIVRDVAFEGERLRIDVTPTYSGCPAMEVIEREIMGILKSHGFSDVTVRSVFSPAWTTDWISAGTKEKLRKYGIAPPVAVASGASVEQLVTIRRGSFAVECPYCGSSNTEEKSEFGSTACKAIHFCKACCQPFDHFKAL
jgi:ring-1,2-phenylacetyl-CoA epoxidase subunit PaaD